MENEQSRRLKPDEFFKNRVAAIKPVIKGKTWRTSFLERNPDWNNAEDLAYLDRVVLLRTADVFVTEQLEAIAKEISDQEAKEKQGTGTEQ